MSSPYDAFAWFYDRYWAEPHRAWQMPALEKLLFPALPPGGRVLDVCCGTGNLARHFVLRGYEVTGVDSSREMLRVARENVPEANFVRTDAADIHLDHAVDAAVCLFDSVNHLLEAEQVAGAFRA